MTTPALAAWAALLDAIDDGLASFPPVLVDLPPSPDPGPLPPSFAARATLTLHRMAEVEAALERHQAELAQELTALSAARATAARASAATPVPHFLDTKA